jgi:hypothetical protein
MDTAFPCSFASASSSAALETTIWSRLIELMGSFDCAVTKNYVSACIALVEKIVSKAQPLVCGADLICAIQTEVPIPTSASELPPAGLLGVCVNLITIVRHAEEDPIECILTALTDGGVDFICFPGAYERESER